MEDLKERYYNICGKLTKVRAASGTEPKIYIFDAGHERRRKEQLDKLFNRTPEQVCNFCILIWILVLLLSFHNLNIDTINTCYGQKRVKQYCQGL